MKRGVRQKNHFFRLSFEARKRVLFLLFDGADYDDIRSDSIVRKCCEERSVSLPDPLFRAVRRSKEYAEHSKGGSSDQLLEIMSDDARSGNVNHAGRQSSTSCNNTRV